MCQLLLDWHILNVKSTINIVKTSEQLDTQREGRASGTQKGCREAAAIGLPGPLVNPKTLTRVHRCGVRNWGVSTEKPTIPTPPPWKLLGPHTRDPSFLSSIPKRAKKPLYSTLGEGTVPSLPWSNINQYSMQPKMPAVR